MWQQTPSLGGATSLFERPLRSEARLLDSDCTEDCRSRPSDSGRFRLLRPTGCFSPAQRSNLFIVYPHTTIHILRRSAFTMITMNDILACNLQFGCVPPLDILDGDDEVLERRGSQQLGQARIPGRGALSRPHVGQGALPPRKRTGRPRAPLCPSCGAGRPMAIRWQARPKYDAY